MIRPPAGTGLQPSLECLFFSNLNPDPLFPAKRTVFILPVWEQWWGYNRLNYLSFKEPIVWITTNQTGETIPINTELRKLASNTLIKTIKDDKSAAVRIAAAIAIGKSREKTASSVLINAIRSDKSDDVRNASLLALGMLEDESSIDILREAINVPKTDANSNLTKSYATLALGYLQNNKSIEILKEIIQPGSRYDRDTKCAALLSLGNLQDKSTIPLVGSILNDQTQDEYIRSYAGMALGRFKTGLILPELKRALKDHKNNVRASVAIAMGSLNPADVKDDLISLLTDKSFEVSAAAALSLASLGDKSAYPALSAALKKSNYELQPVCAIALGILGEEKGIAELRELLKKGRSNVYEAVILGLGLAKDKESVPLIIKTVKEDEACNNVAYNYAVQSLGMIGDTSALAVLKNEFQKIQKTYNCAINSFNNITVSLSMLGEQKEVLKYLLSQLDNSLLNYDVKLRILHGIGYLGDKSAIEPIINFYNAEKNDILRTHAIFALGYVSDRGKINPLYKITTGNSLNPYIRIRAIEQLIGNKLD